MAPYLLLTAVAASAAPPAVAQMLRLLLLLPLQLPMISVCILSNARRVECIQFGFRRRPIVALYVCVVVCCCVDACVAARFLYYSHMYRSRTSARQFIRRRVVAMYVAVYAAIVCMGVRGHFFFLLYVPVSPVFYSSQFLLLFSRRTRRRRRWQSVLNLLSNDLFKIRFECNFLSAAPVWPPSEYSLRPSSRALFSLRFSLAAEYLQRRWFFTCEMRTNGQPAVNLSLSLFMPVICCCWGMRACLAVARQMYLKTVKRSIELNWIYLHKIDWKMASTIMQLNAHRCGDTFHTQTRTERKH